MVLMTLRIPLVRLVFGSSRFDWTSTVLTGRTLSFFAVSIFAQSLIQLFARAFYALYDTKTPVIIGVISVFTNTILSIYFVRHLQLPVWSLAISTSIASITNAILLFIFLFKKVNGFELKKLLIPPLKMGIATLIMGVFLYIPLKLFDQLIFDTTQVFELLMLTGLALFSGGSVYLFLAWFFDIEEIFALFVLLKKVKLVRRVFFSHSHSLVSDDQSAVS